MSERGKPWLRARCICMDAQKEKNCWNAELRLVQVVGKGRQAINSRDAALSAGVGFMFFQR